jgi:hypothetical protein
MTAQPIWITPAGSLGTVPEGAYYEVPLRVTDTFTTNIIGIVGSGSSVTATFYTQPVAMFQPGDTVVVSGVNPSSYNGSFTVTKCTTTQITYTSSATGTWIGGGTITSVPSTVYFEPIAGALPEGIECTSAGVIQGTPTNVVTVADEAVVVGVNVTSKFAIRAYTTKTIGSITVINRLADRTFTITVAGQNLPSWITPAGELSQLWVGELLSPGIQLEYTNDNTTGIPPAISLYSGRLPPGITVSDTGLISGFVQLNPTTSAQPGFSVNGQGFSTYPFDFGVETQSTSYTFTLQVTDGRISALRTFSLYVWSTQAFTADTTLITADNTYLTASISSLNSPVITNPQGSIGTTYSDTYFAYQFVGENITGDPIGYTGTSLPPGLSLNSTTGWLTGYLPTIGLFESTYDFTVTAYLANETSVTSDPYSYSLTVEGPIFSNVTWLTPSNLGTIANGSTSMFYVAATDTVNLNLQYQLVSGSDSRLPQGLTLLPSGNIVGRVSFNAYPTPAQYGKTVYNFTVNAYSTNGYISVNKTFSITVEHVYEKPYQNLYIQCMPPATDRELIASLLENSTIFTPSLLYRPDDPNFGLSRNVVYHHAYGLNAASVDTYVESLQLNHYWKTLLLGEIETAQAVDPLTGKVVYEVVYSEIIDNLVNNNNVSVGKEVVLAYPIEEQTIDVVYPNSLDNMRDQVIDVVGQESNLLPLWMQSPQSNGRVLGFTPAWVIAYTVPGASKQIQYNILTQFGIQLNLVDFVADRYELDNALTVNWNGNTQSWVPSPPETTSFDVNYHYDVSVGAPGNTYAAGNQIKILGTSLDGTTSDNDLLITINTVDAGGAILDAFYYGTANSAASGNSYDNLAGVNVTGSGSGASWDITVVPGIETVFDGGSVTFIDPADTDTSSPAHDRYLLYPKYNILV